MSGTFLKRAEAAPTLGLATRLDTPVAPDVIPSMLGPGGTTSALLGVPASTADTHAPQTTITVNFRPADVALQGLRGRP